jgi:two-component sensor histidine kinase
VNPHRIQKKLDVDNLKIDIDSAVTLGLILNELISNSLKYAFPNGEGEIRIELKIKHNQYILTVADNGIGLPKNFNLDQVHTLGIQLVIRLVNQLEGTISVENFTGTRWRITFPNKYD